MIQADVALARVLLAPVLIISATVVGRRLGPTAGGLIAGLPLTSGPVSILLFAAHGSAFAASAAVGTLRGLLAAIVLIALFAWTARGNWPRGLGVGLVGSMLAAIGANWIQIGAWAAAAYVAVLSLLILASLPRTRGGIFRLGRLSPEGRSGCLYQALNGLDHNLLGCSRPHPCSQPL